MLHERIGDILDTDADAVAHGCNTIGKMGVGLAKQLRYSYPDMYADYKQRCAKGLFRPGQGYIYWNPHAPHIINLATQESGGARMVYVSSALDWLSRSYEELGLTSVAIPQIGCGAGGLEWKTVRAAVNRHFRKSDLLVEIWTLDDSRNRKGRQRR